MKNNVRYHVIAEDGGSGVMIFDCQTGTVLRPECWLDLSAYYHYLVARGHINESQKLLAEAMAGKKPITTMLTNAVTA